MKLNFDIIIVAYNTEIDAIASLNSLLESSEISHIIICDNSTSDSILAHNRKRSMELQPVVKYIPMEGNAGLAKAYNRGIENSAAPFIVIFDDDTAVPPDFIVRVQQHCMKDKADIYLPMVRSRDIIMSPCLKRGLSFCAIEDVMELSKAVKISAINSGMVVRRSFYNKVKYDERLFVDAIDHKFMDDARTAKARIIIMRDVWLQQQFSQELYDKDAQLNRLKIRAKDNYIYYGSSLMGRVYCRLMIGYWALKLAVKYKDVSLIFEVRKK